MAVLNHYPRLEAWSLVSPDGKLHQMGVPSSAILTPLPMRRINGSKAHDGLFELDPAGDEWLAIPEREDVVFWHPQSGDLATWNGQQFALGEDAIFNPATYAMGFSLNIFPDPLAWLKGSRDGIVVMNWRFAFDNLRHAPRIAVDPAILPKFKESMKPQRMPTVSVLKGSKP